MESNESDGSRQNKDGSCTLQIYYVCSKVSFAGHSQAANQDSTKFRRKHTTGQTNGSTTMQFSHLGIPEKRP